MPFIVKGIDTHDEHGNPYLRQDIDKWYAEQVKGDRIQLTLFVEALALIQARPETHLLSYFRLAGIHSAPWCEWDGVPQPPKHPEDDPDRIEGYCVHNNYTFPTWHRVYMMLYERALYDAMFEWIEEHVPEYLQSKWKGEAIKWRLPYWDFARKADRPPSTPGASENDIDHDKLRLPILCMMPNVKTIVYPGVEDYKPRPNPLYKYVTRKLMGKLPEPYTIKGEPVKNDIFTYPWDKCNATTKYGVLDGFDEDIWADGGQNWLRANYALNEHAWYNNPDPNNPIVPTLQDLVFRLFQHGIDNWGSFSSSRYTSKNPKAPKERITITQAKDKLEGNVKNALNLEFIHNNLHNWVGGTQFLRPPKEGIHLWGSGHMSSVYMAAFDPIFFIYHNNIDRLTAMWQMLNWDLWFDDGFSKPTRDNQLIPFHKDEHTFWKSDDVRDWRKLGYDYPILSGRKHNSKEDRMDILKEIAFLYGDLTKQLYNGTPSENKEKDDFVITVIYDRYALNGAPYKINLFLDGADNFRGPESEGFVASIYNFSGSLDSGNCGNCKTQKKEGVKCIAQVPATVPMRRRLEKMKSETTDQNDIPKPLYVVLNSMGVPVRMEGSIHVELHKSERQYFRHPYEPAPNDPLEYNLINHGEQADDAFRDPEMPKF